MSNDTREYYESKKDKLADVADSDTYFRYHDMLERMTESPFDLTSLWLDDILKKYNLDT